jgi:DNA-binding NtrC family response regulator
MAGERHVTVLVVEDDDTVRRLATRVLERGGFSVLAAATGDEALKACREARGGIAVVLADVGLPDLRGPELGRLIQNVEPSARIVFMSGHSPDDLADVARLANARFLAKPFDPDQLLKAVDDAMEEPGS